MSTYFWTILAAISSAVEALVVLLAAWFTIRQLREATRARSLDGFLAISSELNETEARESRRLIYGGLPDPKRMSQDDRERVERVCVTFDRMGVPVEHRLIPEDVAFSMYFDVVIRIWKRVLPFISAERERKGRLYMMYFERLAERCEQHRRKNFPEEKLEPYAEDEGAEGERQ